MRLTFARYASALIGAAVTWLFLLPLQVSWVESLPLQSITIMLAALALFCVAKVFVLQGVAANQVRKLHMLLLGISHLVLSRDKGWSKSKLPNPAEVNVEGKPITFYFIRHGESEWNEVFNKGIPPGLNVHKLKIIPRLIIALARELALSVTRDSIFFDSPLNEDGIRQANELCETLRERYGSSGSKGDGVLLSAGGRSVVVVSNLRRAIETVCLCLRDRLDAAGKGDPEQVVMHSGLQEISRNIDTLALAPKGGVPAMPKLVTALQGSFDLETRFECSTNAGNKPLRGTGLTRMTSFLEWAFARRDSDGTSTFIIGGHSLWFRSFFQTFLPPEGQLSASAEMAHTARTNKIKNCGIIKLQVHSGTLAAGKRWYKIDEKSISSVEAGFEEGKKKR